MSWNLRQKTGSAHSNQIVKTMLTAVNIFRFLLFVLVLRQQLNKMVTFSFPNIQDMNGKNIFNCSIYSITNWVPKKKKKKYISWSNVITLECNMFDCKYHLVWLWRVGNLKMCFYIMKIETVCNNLSLLFVAAQNL